MLANKDNAAFLENLDPWVGDGFPTNEFSARALIEKYAEKSSTNETQEALQKQAALNEEQTDQNIVKTEKSTEVNETVEQVDQTAEQVNQRAEQVDEKAGTVEQKTTLKTEINRNEIQKNDEKLKQSTKNIDALKRALADVPSLNIDADLTRAGALDAQGNINPEALGDFFTQNAERYLQAAKETSPKSLVQAYEVFQIFEDSSPEIAQILTPVLTQYETDYTLAKEYLSNPDFSLPDQQRAKIALDDSRITEIDGDTIRGENGEKLVMTSGAMNLSLEGEDGLELDV